MKKYMAIAGLVLVTVIWGGGFVASDMALDSLSLNAKLQAFPKDGDGRFWKVAMTGKTTSREGVHVSLLPLQNSYQTIEILSQLVLSYSFSSISLIHNL